LTPSPTDTSPRRPLDPDSVAWIDALQGERRAREEAIDRLHALLLRGARFEVARRRASLPGIDARELDDIAHQSAGDALVAILAKLDRFEGRSRFTTWAYKFVVLEAAVKLRRRPWQGRELPLEAEHRPELADHGAAPDTRAEQSDLLVAVGRAVAGVLTPHQREVLVAVALDDVPIDVLAERLGTTRGALYKTIHDARRKLRHGLQADGYLLDEGGRR
jgi:RNA polymerase sigma-70 factor (ECF subfamily)